MQIRPATSKDQVTVPQDLLQKLGMRADSIVRFDLKGDHIELRVEHAAGAQMSSPSVGKSAFGILKSDRRPVPPDFDAASLLRR